MTESQMMFAQELRAEFRSELRGAVDTVHEQRRLEKEEVRAGMRRLEQVVMEQTQVRPNDDASSREVAVELRVDEVRRGLMARVDEAKRSMETRLEEVRLEHVRQLTDVRAHWEARFEDLDFAGMQRRLLVVLREEVAAAFRSEAAAVTTIDRKLRRGLDEFAHKHTILGRQLSPNTNGPASSQGAALAAHELWPKGDYARGDDPKDVTGGYGSTRSDAETRRQVTNLLAASSGLSSLLRDDLGRQSRNEFSDSSQAVDAADLVGKLQMTKEELSKLSMNRAY